MFGRVDLPFVHYIITPKTLKHNYLIVPKMFLETVKFGDPPSVSQINNCLLVTLEIRGVSSDLDGMLYNLHRYLLSQSLLLKRGLNHFPQPSPPRYFF